MERYELASPSKSQSIIGDLEQIPGLLAKQFSGLETEGAELLGKRNRGQDNERDIRSTNAYLGNPELEAAISKLTISGLQKDADKFEPKHNQDGSTTYKVVELGLSNRNENGEDSQGHQTDSGTASTTKPHYYERAINITVPRDAANLGECKFDFGSRKILSQDDFQKQLEHDRARLAELQSSPPNTLPDVELYSHGVYTYSRLSDAQGLLLELTNGRPTVNIDWPAYPNTEKNPNRPDLSPASYLHYMEDRSSARNADKSLAPLIDQTIRGIGADHTVMVAFSHGGMFDARYLRHRVDNGLPKVSTVVMAHPDLPLSSRTLHVGPGVRESLLSNAASEAYVIGGQSDKQLKLAAFTPFALGVRAGNDSPRTRAILQHDHVEPITESDRHSPGEDQHILNYAGIAELLNGTKGRTLQQKQVEYNKMSELGRKH